MSQFFSVLIGAALAAAFGILAFEWQKFRTDQSRRINIARVFQAEIDTILKGLYPIVHSNKSDALAAMRALGDHHVITQVFEANCDKLGVFEGALTGDLVGFYEGLQALINRGKDLQLANYSAAIDSQAVSCLENLNIWYDHGWGIYESLESITGEKYEDRPKRKNEPAKTENI